jgi:hypothetical protein
MRGLEQRVLESEQHNEECFISLEIACSEVETGQAKMEKWFDGLMLEVHRINCFLKRENFENPQGKPGIFDNKDSSCSSRLARDEPDGQHADGPPWVPEIGVSSTQPLHPSSLRKKLKYEIQIRDERVNGRLPLL